LFFCLQISLQKGLQLFVSTVYYYYV